MSIMLFRRQLINLSCILNSQFLLRVCSYSSRPTRACQANELNFVDDSKPHSAAANVDNRVFHLSPLYRDIYKDSLKDCKIEIVDNETWRVSSGLAEAWRDNTNVASKKKSFSIETEIDDEATSYASLNEDGHDFDEIEDMRIRGNLFYKLDKDSKEYEEYKFEFHRRNKNKNNGNDGPKEKEKSNNVSASRVEKGLKGIDEKQQNKKEKLSYNSASPFQNFQLNDFGASPIKRLRVPTFNQLTAPYHEPFCLDIYVSKGSVSASIIHRATSKVVVVAHSISKDMKFDLGSTKNRATCAAIGEVLAQRALADDIHNVVYTPRKGEKLEGKLEIVLQSIINNGINVKVKIKQRKTKKPGFHRPTA
ncbi:uncharacterized protein [Nicotiana sylvestris]|uniref:Uncharacterized protein LOC104241475 n=1 Tax=Nicotiana sylvestris TaxID=4096 RepID=A0A1U7Y650_NICSY|nr:PREDICTED: uncharacterized protein LOC104241475 [Nicotiana sylvestris]